MNKRIKWILNYWRRHKLFLIVLFSFALISTAFTVAYPLLFKYIIDRFTEHLKNDSFEKQNAVIFKIAMITLLVGFARFVTGFYPCCRAIFNLRCEVDIREDIFAKILSKSYRFFLNFRTGDLVTRLTDDISDYPKIAWFLGSGIFRALESSSKFIFCFIVLLTLNWRLALVTVVPLPIMMVIFLRLNKKVGDKWQAFRREVSNTNDAIEAAFSGVRIVKAFRAEENLTRKLREDLARRVSVETGIIILWMCIGFIYESIGTIGQIIVIVMGGYMVLTTPPLMSLGDFFAFYVYLGMLLYPLLDIPTLFVSAKQAFVSMDREDEISEFEPEKEVCAENMINKHSLEKIDHIEFRDVSYHYLEQQNPVVDGLSFTIKKGTKIAFVGEVGSGKSTVIKLLLGQLTPNKGQILVNGRDLKEINLLAYWKQIGYVPQESFIFNDTIKENISLGTSLSEDKIAQVIEQVNLTKEISEMKEGVNTKLGLRGFTISGGQAQRLSIARTLAKRPEIYVWDDCFSSLDAENEKMIWQATKDGTNEQAYLLATHRLGTVADFDQVFVLEDGKVAEQGKHDDLMAKKGVYHKLVTAKS